MTPHRLTGRSESDRAHRLSMVTVLVLALAVLALVAAAQFTPVHAQNAMLPAAWVRLSNTQFDAIVDAETHRPLMTRNREGMR